jgi:soluble lytic murein transglycosylase-like protein
MKLVLVMKKYTHLFLFFIVLLFNITSAKAQTIQRGYQRASTPEVSRTGFWPLQSLSRAATTLALMTAEIAVPMGPLYTPEPPATIEARPAPIKVMNQFEASATETSIVSAPNSGRDFRASVSRHLNGQTTGDMEIDEILVEAGTEYGVEPLLLYSVMNQESAFNTQATSHKGARGLMQLMPATAARFGVKNIYDPEQNINGAAQYLRLLLDMFDGDVRLALAGYNAGEGAVKKYGNSVPPYPETINYVRKITHRYTILTTLSE